jgi:hypothetical protein
MNLKSIVEQLKSNPKIIFLIDGIGAVITFLSLFGIGFWLHEYFGMPKNVLYSLAFVVVFYAIYSFSCYFFLFDKIESSIKKWQSFLKVIIVANSFYCVVLGFLLIYFYETLTVLGFIYFTIEISVITVLVILEVKMTFKEL